MQSANPAKKDYVVSAQVQSLDTILRHSKYIPFLALANTHHAPQDGGHNMGSGPCDYCNTIDVSGGHDTECPINKPNISLSGTFICQCLGCKLNLKKSFHNAACVGLCCNPQQPIRCDRYYKYRCYGPVISGECARCHKRYMYL